MQTVTADAMEGIEPPVRIYVRKGEDKDARHLTFEFPDWLSQGEMLDRGWAIDGTSVLVTVAKKELLNAERELVEFFRLKGHGITFC